MENKISINNTNIANYAMFMLNKIDNEFTEEELRKIEEITINYDEEQENSLMLKELLLFPNLKTIYIRNGYIYNDDFHFLLKLENLNNIYFEKCEFENADLIASLKLKSLSLINCNINNYTFVNILEDLEQLSIVNGSIDINKINRLKKLNYLQISYSNICDNETVLQLNNLKELHIDNTNITNLSFINTLSNLNRLSIDEKQYQNNKILITQLQNKNVKVYNENLIEFIGDEYES